LPLSRTLATKDAVPEAVGLPEIAPEELSERPAGRLPDASVHVYAGVPPVTERVCE